MEVEFETINPCWICLLKRWLIKYWIRFTGWLCAHGFSRESVKTWQCTNMLLCAAVCRCICSSLNGSVRLLKTSLFCKLRILPVVLAESTISCFAFLLWTINCQASELNTHYCRGWAKTYICVLILPTGRLEDLRLPWEQDLGPSPLLRRSSFKPWWLLLTVSPLPCFHLTLLDAFLWRCWFVCLIKG